MVGLEDGLIALKACGLWDDHGRPGDVPMDRRERELQACFGCSSRFYLVPRPGQDARLVAQQAAASTSAESVCDLPFIGLDVKCFQAFCFGGYEELLVCGQ
jgi:hypothetical protein